MIATLAAIVLLGGIPATSLAASTSPSSVSIGTGPGDRYSYVVNGQEQTFIGMGYNPIYRFLTPLQRGADYARDFRLMCQAGVNTITGWDADKGYQQDTFDELTLFEANQYGIGVVMPFYLPPDGDYNDPDFLAALTNDARTKIERFKGNPALRMWGLGNEVLTIMPPEMHDSFLSFYLTLADVFHTLDPNHPVIYREAEDAYVPALAEALQESGDPRPWLLYGTNVYNQNIGPILGRWPSYGLNRPLFVSEFGPGGAQAGQRGLDYASMWRTIRSYPDFVLGGAPYVWTTQGPEPTDQQWGLMDALARPVDDTFVRLAQLWHAEPKGNHSNCG